MNASDLNRWADPDSILDALYRVPREPQDSLRPAIALLLDHDDQDIREEALRILVTRWKDEAYRGLAAQMLVVDPAPNVRGAAAYALAAVADDSTRSEHTKLLLRSLLNELEDLNVRGAIYDALLILHRRPAFPTKQRDFNPTVDVDWQWVNSLTR